MDEENEEEEEYDIDWEDEDDSNEIVDYVYYTNEPVVVYKNIDDSTI